MRIDGIVFLVKNSGNTALSIISAAFGKLEFGQYCYLIGIRQMQGKTKPGPSATRYQNIVIFLG